ncbi:MAG: antitoxin [Candidatus Electrothrix sp. AR3]|nr:antitoxin [Candidatus Electrothrix sp. AR3]
MNAELDSYEKEIFDAFEQGTLNSVADLKNEMADAREAAKNTFNKNKRVNLRMTEQDFDLAHIRALEDGIPYQTLLSSIIHKYLTGRLVEKT